MNMFLEPFLIALPFTAAALAVLLLGRRQIDRQLDEVADAAEAGAFKRPFAFRRGPSLPARDRQPNLRAAEQGEPAEGEDATPAMFAPPLNLSTFPI